MLMTNEYRSAFKRVHTAEQEAELRAIGWTIVEEKPEAAKKAESEKTCATPMEAPKIVNVGKNQLMYKGKYLSQWVSFGTKKELQAIFDYFGIPYTPDSLKSEMVTRLREYIREAKVEKGRE